MSVDKFNDKQEAETAVKLAIGGLFRMGARPTQPGDLQKYYQCRDLLFDAVEFLYLNEPTNQFYKDLYFNHIFK